MIGQTTKEIQLATIEDLNHSIDFLAKIIAMTPSRARRAQARGHRNSLIRQLGVKREENARS
jgi:hypothetical protein